MCCLLTCLPAASLHAQTVVSVAEDRANNTWMLWDYPGGAASLWEINNATGALVTQYPAFGPFSGWTAKAVSIGTDNLPRLLWNHAPDNQASLWTVTSATTYSHTEYGPTTGWSAVGLTSGPGGITYLLWNKTDGTASVYSINAVGTLYHAEYGPFTGYTATALAVGPDNLPSLLWHNTNGGIALWKFASNGTYTSQANYATQPSYAPLGLTVGPDNVAHVLWNKVADGTCALWNIAVGSNSTYNLPFTAQTYGPYSGWTVNSEAIGSDNLARLAWNNVNGPSALWTVAANGTFTSYTYPIAAGLGLDASSVTAGASLNGTVSLNVPALPGGAVVTLTSSAPSVASVPSSVTVPSGSSGVTFPINTYGVSATTTVTFTAVCNGSSVSTPLIINPNRDFSLSIPNGTITIGQGSKIAIPISIVPKYGFSGSVSFTVSGTPVGVGFEFDPNPANSTSTLNLYANQNATVGSVTVTVKGVSGGYPTHTISFPVTVIATPRIYSFIVTPNPVNQPANTGQQFYARVQDQFGNQIASPPYNWSFSPSYAGYLSNTGYFTAGNNLVTCYIYATPVRGGINAGAAIVHIVGSVQPTLTSITVTPNPANLTVMGTQQFTATGNYSDGSTQDFTNSVSWSSASGSITSSGFYTAPNFSVTDTVTAAFGQFSGSAAINVTGGAILSSIVVTPGTAYVAPGSTQLFTAIAYDQNGIALTPQPTFTWSVTGGGGISTYGGLFAAGSMMGGPYTVTASAGNTNGTAAGDVSTFSGGGTGDPSGTDPYFNVSGSHLDVTQSANGNVTGTTMFSVSPSNGFIGTLTPTLSGLPAGVTATFNPATLIIGSTSSVSGSVTFSVPSNVLPGFYPLMLNVASGSIADSDSLDLNIIPAPNSANFSLSADSDVVEMSQPSTRTINLTLNQSIGFSGTVSLSLADDPTHPILQSSTFSHPALSSTLTASALTLQIGNGIPEGAYHLMISGTGASGTQLLPLTIYVLADESNGIPAEDLNDNATTPPDPLAASLSDTLRIDLSVQGSLVPFLREPHQQHDESESTLMTGTKRLLQPNDIIGNTSLIYVKSIFPNFDYPYSAVCRIACFFNNGDKQWGTGTLVGYNHVLTAAHLFQDEKHVNLYCNRIRVYPAFDGDQSKTYGSAVVKRYHITKNFRDGINEGVRRFDDYALLDLYLVGPQNSKGYRSTLGYGPGYVPMAADFNGVRDTDTYIAGYPQYPNKATNPLGLYMYASYGHYEDDGDVIPPDQNNPLPGLLLHSISIIIGDSGAGLRHSPGGRYTVYGVVQGGKSASLNYNTATWITDQRLAILKSWMVSDGDEVPY